MRVSGWLPEQGGDWRAGVFQGAGLAISFLFISVVVNKQAHAPGAPEPVKRTSRVWIPLLLPIEQAMIRLTARRLNILLGERLWKRF